MVEAVPSEEKELDEGMTMLAETLDRLDNEEEEKKEALVEWVTTICDPEYAMVEGLVANFIDFIDDKEYAKKILKILV